MTLTVAEVIKDARGLIHVIAIDEAPTVSEYNQALRTANVMMGRWATQRLILRSTTELSFQLVAGTSSYTVAPSGAAITAAKPVNITSGYITDAANLDTPIEVIDMVTYNNLFDKNVSPGKPRYVAYEPGVSQQIVSTGTIYVYYKPDTSYTLNLSVDSFLTEFTATTDVINFEPTYYEALIYNLAVRLFRYYRDATIPVPADILEIAKNSLNNLKTMNNVPTYAGCDIPTNSGKYNIYTDGN